MITSIHKAKGLEYPVVFLADTSHSFNKDDLKKPLLIHPELGAGPKMIDLNRRISYTTLPRMAIAEKLRLESLAEEMRLLYVAMTRARERLIITVSCRNAAKELSRIAKGLSLPLQPEVLRDAQSLSDWILYSAMLRPEAAELRQFSEEELPVLTDGNAWRAGIFRASGRPLEAARPAAAEEEGPCVSEEALEEVSRKLSFKYAYPAATSLPTKLTATQLKGRTVDFEVSENTPGATEPKPFIFDRPRFAGGGGLTSAEKGTAAHLVMQYIDFSRCSSPRGIKEEIDRLVKTRMITADQAAAVSPSKIFAFFASPIGKEALASKTLRREFKFSVLVGASRYLPDAAEENILLQGVVDCYFESENGLTIIDFKTDNVNEKTIAARAAEYAGQIAAYAGALEEITGRTVERRILYFFATGEQVEI